MHLNHRLEYQSLENRTREHSKVQRSREFQPLIHLQSLDAFGTQIHRKLVNCRSAGRRPAVMLLAIEAVDGGVAYGELPSALGARLRGRVRSTDVVVQVGDRFGVYLDGDVAPHTTAIRERLTLALLDEFVFGDLSVRIRPRFGVAVHPGAPIGGIDLVRAAALAIEG